MDSNKDTKKDVGQSPNSTEIKQPVNSINDDKLVEPSLTDLTVGAIQ